LFLEPLVLTHIS